MAYQQTSVGVDILDNQLIILDPGNSEEIARHVLMVGKGHIVKNTDHYRDQAKRIADYEAGISELLGDATARPLCALVKQTSPRIYRDQLAGISQLLMLHADIEPKALERLLEKPRLTATMVRDYLQAYERDPERLSGDADEFKPGSSALLEQYAGLTTATQRASA